MRWTFCATIKTIRQGQFLSQFTPFFMEPVMMQATAQINELDGLIFETKDCK